MSMNNCGLAWVGLVIVLSASTSSAELIVFEDFEKLPSGSAPADGDDFATSGPWVRTLFTAPVSAKYRAYTPSVSDPDLPQGGSFAGHIEDSSGALIIDRNFTPITAGILQLDYYMRSNSFTDEGAFVGLRGDVGNDIFASFGNAAGGGAAGFIGIFNDTGWPDPTFLAYEVGEWYHVRRTLDVATRLGTIFVAKVDASGADILAKSNTGIFSSFAANTSINQVEIFTSGSQGADTYLDNISVSVVPEPSSLVLFTLGIVGLVFIERRRRKRMMAA